MGLRSEGGKVFLSWGVEVKADGEDFPGLEALKALERAKRLKEGTIDGGGDRAGRGFLVAAAALDARLCEEEIGLRELKAKASLSRMDGKNEIWAILCEAELTDPGRLLEAAREAHLRVWGFGLYGDSLEEAASELLIGSGRNFGNGWDEGLKLVSELQEGGTSPEEGVALLERESLEGGSSAGARGSRRSGL